MTTLTTLPFSIIARVALVAAGSRVNPLIFPTSICHRKTMRHTQTHPHKKTLCTHIFDSVCVCSLCAGRLNWKTAHYLIFLCKIIQFISATAITPLRGEGGGEVASNHSENPEQSANQPGKVMFRWHRQGRANSQRGKRLCFACQCFRHTS